MKDVIIIGGGLAGLAAAWRLRHWDIHVLEADQRCGGRIRSERRGDYWLNWGGHVFAGPGSSTDALLKEVGIDAVEIPGSMQGLSMNGTFIKRGHIATYPFRIPMPLSSRLSTIRAGMKVLGGVAKYTAVVRKRTGETDAMRQQRIYEFQNSQSFQDFLGSTSGDAAALFSTTVTRSGGDMNEICSGAGLGYFSLVLGFGQGLNRGIVGGPSTLTETIAAALGDRLQLGATVHEVIHRSNSVLVRYKQNGAEKEATARYAILATTADVSRQIGVDLPADLREALGLIRYGPHVSSAFLTDETAARPWDDVYAIAAPKRSFAIALNQASIVRGAETVRRPGGSFMTFSPASLGRALLESSDEEVIETHLRDLDQVLGHRFADSVVEAHAARWKVASPYNFPGRAKLQSTLMRGTDRVFLAGDYLGSLYTESSTMSGFTAAQDAASRLATARQLRTPSIPVAAPPATHSIATERQYS